MKAPDVRNSEQGGPRIRGLGSLQSTKEKRKGAYISSLPSYMVHRYL